MFNILIVGCGNIGKRHLFSSLKLKKKINIQVLENNLKQIKISKKINKNFDNYIKNFESINKNTNLVLCATKAFKRDKIIKKILNFCTPEYMIIEKFPFQNIIIYNKMIKFLKNKKIKVWVNFPFRYQDYYKYIIKNILKKNSILSCIISLSKTDDLFSSGIHFLDLLIHNHNYNLEHLDLRHIKKNNKYNWRYNGKVVFSTKDRTIAIINSKSNFEQQINIFSLSNHYKVKLFSSKINPWDNPKVKIFKNDKLIKVFDHYWQSSLTEKYLNDMILKKDTSLPTLFNTKYCTELVIDAVKKKLSLVSAKDLCPIT